MDFAKDITVHVKAPGRTELAGNHTDHQGGRVIAAAIDRYIEIDLFANSEPIVRIESDGFPPFELQLDGDPAFHVPHPAESETTAALVRGVIAGFVKRGIVIPGFVAHAESSVPVGGGLSSSAAFEIALCRALSAAFADNALSAESMIDISCEAERTFFGKLCGRMDQTAIALGGINLIDFSLDSLHAEALNFDFEQAGYRIILVDTHTDHASCTSEYQRIPQSMYDTAAFFGESMLSRIPEEQFAKGFQSARKDLGDSTVLRALHYYNEMHLVDARANALRTDDMAAFLRATRSSNASSGLYLQNAAVPGADYRPMVAALGIAELFLNGEGAVRVHGGGFGGYIQAFVPTGMCDSFSAYMDDQLGEGSCLQVHIAPSSM